MMRENSPLVSCIMPTADRRSFVPQAIQFFLEQDYPNKELVIIDDGASSVEDLAPSHPQIRYLRMDRNATIGAKRNYGCARARGDLIAHWDDDDWHAPWRLSYQVSEMLEHRADICGLDRLLFYDASNHRAWHYTYPPASAKSWVAGGTMCYQKQIWEKRPFVDIDCGEDTRFVWDHKHCRIHALENTNFYVALIHSGNTSTKQTNRSRWRPCSTEQVTRIVGSKWPMVNERSARSSAARKLAPAYSPQANSPLLNSLEPSSHHSSVVVSIPYYRCEPYVRRAVDSILRQTHQNLQVVVVNSGDPEPPWKALESIDDPRLVRFDLPENRGPYFAHAAVLEATSAEYFVVQDADDWSEPQRIQQLLHAARREYAVAATSPNRNHSDFGGTQVERYPNVNAPLSDQLTHRTNHHNLSRVQTLRQIGGYYAGFRVGYDTLLVSLLLMVGRIAHVDWPLYNRQLRPDSLTRAAKTGLRSPYRRRITTQLERHYQALMANYRQYLAGEWSHEELTTTIHDAITESVTPSDRAAIRKHAEQLRDRFSSPSESAIDTCINTRIAVTLSGKRPAQSIIETMGGSSSEPVAEIPASSVHAVATRRDATDMTVDELLGSPEIPHNSWSMGRSAMRALAERLGQLRPHNILEMGSGLTTLVLAQHVSHHGGAVLSLEHDWNYYLRTQSLLKQWGLSKFVHLVHAELKPMQRRGQHHQWYDTKHLTGKYDFVLVDGPPQSVGRDATMDAIHSRLSTGWELWLHDGVRSHEMQCLKEWEMAIPFRSSLRMLDDAGMWILTPKNSTEAIATSYNNARIGIGVLTGKRCELLQRTLESLDALQPQLLANSFVQVLINSRDSETEAYARSLDYVDVCEEHDSNTPISIGDGTSRLMKAILENTDVDYVLHLEDDWEATGTDVSWLDRAIAILDEAPTIGQVRLRHVDENVLSRHLITAAPIQWKAYAGFHLADSAHLTFNPNLMRAVDVRRIYPCTCETDAQRSFLATGMATAQLLPGVFRHIGDHLSLRRRTTMPWHDEPTHHQS